MNTIVILLLIIIACSYLCVSISSFIDKYDDDIDNYFDDNIEVFVINLVDSFERKESITDQLDKQNITYQIIEAVDGVDFDLDKDKRWHCNHHNKKNVSGTRGRWLSDLYIYEMITYNKHKYKYTLILEDDAILPKNFKYEIYQAIMDYPNGQVFRLQKLLATEENYERPRWGAVAQLYKSNIIPIIYKMYKPDFKSSTGIKGCTSDERLYSIIYSKKLKLIQYPIINMAGLKSTIATSSQNKYRILKNKKQIKKEVN